jgi:hypothetical protein
MTVSAAFHRPDLPLVQPAITDKKPQANVGLREDASEPSVRIEPKRGLLVPQGQAMIVCLVYARLSLF